MSKAHADVVLISGHDGGTGAAPLTSLKHAGLPWELGLAETQQTLLLNGLRDRITVQVDGAMKTGRDVVVAALLGAEEYGFATAPLIVSGCIMMRVCHLDTCPVGVATQNPLLRERFTGKPEFVETFFTLHRRAGARDPRLARVPFAGRGHRAGRRARHRQGDRALEGRRARPGAGAAARRRTRTRRACTARASRTTGSSVALDNTLIQLCEGALLDAAPVKLELPVRNVNRTVGTMLGSLVTRRYGADGLAPGTIDITFTGSGGQSFGAFVPRGITLRLLGDTNDYAGKGLSGGVIAVRPHPDAALRAEDNVIAGNVIGYGATAGEIYLRGVVGERFCVRNSGATVVAEGVGDHALEYMTGGIAVVLGDTGRNLGAGMSGGYAYVLDLQERLVNTELVDVEALTDEDARRLRDVVEAHVAYTDSAVGAALLADWPAALTRFSAVVPARLQARHRGDPRGRGRRRGRRRGRDGGGQVLAPLCLWAGGGFRSGPLVASSSGPSRNPARWRSRAGGLGPKPRRPGAPRLDPRVLCRVSSGSRSPVSTVGERWARPEWKRFLTGSP